MKSISKQTFIDMVQIAWNQIKLNKDILKNGFRQLNLFKDQLIVSESNIVNDNNEMEIEEI